MVRNSVSCGNSPAHDFAAEQEEHCTHQTKPRPEIVQGDFLAQVKQAERHKNYQSNHLTRHRPGEGVWKLWATPHCGNKFSMLFAVVAAEGTVLSS